MFSDFVKLIALCRETAQKSRIFKNKAKNKSEVCSIKANLGFFVV